MPLTPEDVSNKRFTAVRLREGYDMGEVDAFLDEVEAELVRLDRENSELRTKLEAAQSGQDGQDVQPGGATTTTTTTARSTQAPRKAELRDRRRSIRSLLVDHRARARAAGPAPRTRPASPA